MARPKTGCSPECREEAVKPLIETSHPIAKVAKELVINAGTLSNWVKAYPRNHAEKELPLTIDERVRLKEQECEIRGSVWKLGFLRECLISALSFSRRRVVADGCGSLRVTRDHAIFLEVIAKDPLTITSV
ncbi:transposase [Streptosporangium roseum]|uniref:transposase n=1 Tax=Streptosporangium roseum TaxID=2001 RepID=UPI00332F3B2F